MQPFFFGCHPTATFAHIFGVLDDICELTEVFAHIFLFPFAELLIFFGHYFLHNLIKPTR
jgi:hypothetical protein